MTELLSTIANVLSQGKAIDAVTQSLEKVMLPEDADQVKLSDEIRGLYAMASLPRIFKKGAQRNTNTEFNVHNARTQADLFDNYISGMALSGDNIDPSISNSAREIIKKPINDEQSSILNSLGFGNPLDPDETINNNNSVYTNLDNFRNALDNTPFVKDGYKQKSIDELIKSDTTLDHIDNLSGVTNDVFKYRDEMDQLSNKANAQDMYNSAYTLTKNLKEPMTAFKNYREGLVAYGLSNLLPKKEWSKNIDEGLISLSNKDASLLTSELKNNLMKNIKLSDNSLSLLNKSLVESDMKPVSTLSEVFDLKGEESFLKKNHINDFLLKNEGNNAQLLKNLFGAYSAVSNIRDDNILDKLIKGELDAETIKNFISNKESYFNHTANIKDPIDTKNTSTYLTTLSDAIANWIIRSKEYDSGILGNFTFDEYKMINGLNKNLTDPLHGHSEVSMAIQSFKRDTSAPFIWKKLRRANKKELNRILNFILSE